MKLSYESASDRAMVADPAVMRDWHKGRSAYCVWMYRLTDPRLLSLIHAIQARLLQTGCVLPVTRSHMTVFVAGFKAAMVRHNDDILFSTLREQVANLSAARLLCPRLVVTGVRIDRCAIYLECHDATQNTARARAALGAAGAEIRFAPFLPHITLGHFLDDIALGDVAAVLEPWIAQQATITVSQPDLELIEFDATQPATRHVGLCKDDFSSLHLHPFPHSNTFPAPVLRHLRPALC